MVEKVCFKNSLGTHAIEYDIVIVSDYYSLLLLALEFLNITLFKPYSVYKHENKQK